MIIKKKCWPEYFEKILSGDKKFEVRLADFECNVGDILLLEEYDPQTQRYTGRTLSRKITYIVKTKEFDFWIASDIETYGFQIMSLEKVELAKASMTYTVPQLGDNVIKNAKLIRICKTRGCAKPVFVSQVYVRSGRIDYSCPEHGKRNRAQMDWMDITGSTMLVFRKVGLQ